MPDLEPITRDEKLWSGEDLEPITRREMYIKHLYDETQVIPEKPITREEMFILKAGEELHDVTIEQLNVTENGTYSEAGKAYSPVIVDVPETTLTTLDVTENGTYTAPSGTAYDEVDVNVPLPENAYLVKDIPATPASIATFTDGSALPMPKLEVAVEPQQSGSGDPSPENIRPIIGWSAVDVTKSGFNVWDEEWKNGYYNNGVFIYSSDGICCKNKIPIKPNTTLYYVKNFDINTNFYYTFYDINGDFLPISGYDASGRISKSSSGAINVPNGAYFMTFNMGSGYGATYNNNISINYPSTDTEYHAYNPNSETITIQLGDTYYGGKLDVVSGVLTVDSYGITITGTESYIYKNSNDASIYGLYVDSFPEHPYFSGDSASVMYRGVCSMFKKASYLPSDQMQDHTIDSYGGGFGNTGLTGSWIRFKELSFADYTIEQAKAKLAEFYTNNKPLQIVFPMVEKTIQLTPTQVNSLMGVNNIWADCGDIIDGQYFSKGE